MNSENFIVVVIVIFLILGFAGVIYMASYTGIRQSAISRYCLLEGYDAGTYDHSLGFYCYNYIFIPDEIIMGK